MLIVGLGNPGANYLSTRHNIGFMVIDKLIDKFDARKISSPNINGELYKFQNHYLLKPLTFMNLSGDAIKATKEYYKIEDTVVIHDDLDLEFATLRFKFGGGHGGHNGLKSTDANISREYTRIRMGIGKPKYKGEVSSYVLGNFTHQELLHLEHFLEHTTEAIEFLLQNTLENTSSKYTIKKQKNDLL